LSTGFIGILTGSTAEARALASLAGPRFRIAVSAADASRAEAQARAFLRDGAVGLISAGLCGALDPRLRTGDALRPAAILDADGHRYATAGGAAGRVFGSDRLVRTPEEKAQLFATSKALAVDMESHRVARVAAASCVPFLALRVVADTAAETLPKGAATLLDKTGNAPPHRLAALSLREPLLAARMMRSGAHALRALKRQAIALSAEPLFGA
jgi:adenosylhomocysteine nucleosidase